MPNKDTSINIIPALNATLDLNGFSKSFIITTTLGFSNSSINWLGDHSQYETPDLYFRFSHTANDSLLIFSFYADNVWNPRIININTNNVVSGSMRPNADMSDDLKFVEYLPDGSRIVIGSARGKTAFDTLATGIKSNPDRSDAFIARITSKGELKWYKRLNSTLRQASPIKLMMKENKAYFLINYMSSVNENDYLQVDKTTYSVQHFQSLLASIDTFGNINVINLENKNLKDSYVIDFNFCPNGDVALLTNITAPASYFSFPQSIGFFLFRINPLTNLIIATRKFIADDPFVFQPAHIQIDSNDFLYLSIPVNFPGTMENKHKKLLLHNGNDFIDSIEYENNVSGIDFGGLGILKMNWNKFNWYKRSSGKNGFAAGGSHYPEIFTINNKIVFMGRPYSNYGDTSKNSFYWDNKLIMSDMSPFKNYLFRMDTSGKMEMHKAIDEFYTRFAKKKTDGSIFISGYTSTATSIDTISVGYNGATDAVSFIIDSNFTAKRSFRLATPHFEFMSDMDVFQDSLVTFAYSAQTPPSLYANRPTALVSDNEANAFLGSTVIEKQVILPLQLISFNAIRKDNIVNLDWTIVSNEEGGKYIVQRSQNGLAFKNIDIKNSVNGSSAVIYRTSDNLNDYGKYYYRLQLISRDGKISYSKIVSIIYPPKQSSFYYDNNSHQLHILRTNTQPYQWRIFDATGKTILTGQKTIGNKLIDLSRQPGGQYIVRTLDENSIDQTYKFIK